MKVIASLPIAVAPRWEGATLGEAISVLLPVNMTNGKALNTHTFLMSQHQSGSDISNLGMIRTQSTCTTNECIVVTVLTSVQLPQWHLDLEGGPSLKL